MVRSSAPRRRRAPRRKIVQKKKTTRPSTTFKKKVQAVISANIEDKYATTLPGKATATNPGTPASSDPGDGILCFAAVVNNASISTVYPLMPPITQGLDNSQRIGDKIRPKSLVVKFQIGLNGQALNAVGASQNVYARLLCLSDKSLKHVPDLITNPALASTGTPVETQLLELGNGLTSGIGLGGPIEFSYRINRKRYTVHHDRLIKLQKGTGETNQPTGLVYGTMVYNSSLMTHMVTLRIPCPKTLLYPESTAGGANDYYPTNFAPFFCMALMTMDGQQNAAYQTNLDGSVKLNYVAHFDYEDA